MAWVRDLTFDDKNMTAPPVLSPGLRARAQAAAVERVRELLTAERPVS